nr:hypothetical protein OG296_07770 [Streptomyces sp. NBC_01001]
MLVEHHLRRVDGRDLGVLRLVRPGPGTDVDDGARAAQRLPDQRAQPGIGPPYLLVADPYAVVRGRRSVALIQYLFRDSSPS